MRRTRWVLVPLSVLLLAACGDDNGGDDGNGGGGIETTVTATDFAFDPPALTAEPGAQLSVTLVNDGDVTHSFTIDELDVDVEADGGDEATSAFAAPDSGSVEFYCRFHPTQMRGALTVSGDTAGDDMEEDPGGGADDRSFDY